MPITLTHDVIDISFPEVDTEAAITVSIERTLRVPDDDNRYGLPPGLGHFPLRRVEDLPADGLPSAWRGHGGVVLPMWQSEACWLRFSTHGHCSYLVKVGCGGINAVTGEPFTATPDFEAEDYFEVPGQPWLDGFCTDRGTVAQFVAMPLGSGYTVEEQITGKARHGGIQLAVWPLRRDVHEAREKARLKAEQERRERFGDQPSAPLLYAVPAPVGAPPGAGMGMGAGGSVTQSINTPIEPHDNWDITLGKTIAVHLANSAGWEAITGTPPPSLPPTAADYTRAGLPWFDWYDDSLARAGSPALSRVKRVFGFGTKRGEQPLPENESFTPPEPIVLGNQVSDSPPA